MAGDVPAAETVAYGADLGDVVGGLDCRKGCVDYGVDLGGWVPGEPGG